MSISIPQIELKKKLGFVCNSSDKGMRGGSFYQCCNTKKSIISLKSSVTFLCNLAFVCWYIKSTNFKMVSSVHFNGCCNGTYWDLTICVSKRSCHLTSSAAPWPEPEGRRVQGSSHGENQNFKERQNYLCRKNRKKYSKWIMNNVLLILHQMMYAALYSSTLQKGRNLNTKNEEGIQSLRNMKQIGWSVTNNHNLRLRN